MLLREGGGRCSSLPSCLALPERMFALAQAGCTDHIPPPFFSLVNLMISTWYFGVIAVVFAVGVAIVSVHLARARVSMERLRRHNEIAAPIHATVGVVYAVLLAFVVIVVWERFNDAEQAVIDEADELIGLARDVATLDDRGGEPFRACLRNYARWVRDVEWEEMEKGVVPHVGNRFHDSLWSMLAAIEPGSLRGEVWLQAAVRRMNAVEDARGRRPLAVESTVPDAMWILLICGGVIIIVFAAFFGAEHALTHMIMVSALAALVAFSLFLIAAIDQPFSGVVRVENEAFRHVFME